MKAIVIEGPGRAAVRDVPVPAVGPGDVLTRVAYVGICGTDLAILSGDMSLVRDGLLTYPVRIGHEWSGVVERVGPGVRGFAPGDRVVSDTGVTCGTCAYCRRGDLNHCPNGRSLGTVNHWPGAFAEYMLMPERHMHRLPDSIALDEGALIEPATIALAGVRKIEMTPATTVLVVGTGAIGLAAVALAKAAGAGRVLLGGRKAVKLAVGAAMGADAVVDVTREDLTSFARRETGGRGVDAVIETSGNIETIEPCLSAAAVWATIALIGFYERRVKDFNIDALVFKGIQLRGILGEYGLVERVIDAMVRSRITFTPLITHRFPFDQTLDVMRTADERSGTRIKMLVEVSPP